MVVTQVTRKIPLAPGVAIEKEQDNFYSNQILILFSAPLLTTDLSPVEELSIQQEIEAIISVLEDLPRPISLEVVVKVATSETLQDVLSSSKKPLIIHFIGHGMKEGENTALVLEDKVGMSRVFTQTELEIALSNQKYSPCQLALLNACNSEKLAQAFVQAGVPHIIAINADDKILDVAARCFSRRLYQALFNQDSVVDSFLKSRNAVKLDDDLKKLFHAQTLQQGVNFDEAFKFELLPPNPHNQSLTIEPSLTHNIISPQWLNTNIPPDDPNFVGRKLEIHRVIKVLEDSDNRCLILHGMGGIGKTTLAYAIGRWLHERDRYKNGVWFISLRDVKDVGTLITKINTELELDSFAIERKLKNSRLFLILDDLDELIKNEPEQLINLLNSLIEQCRNLRLLLTARTSLARDLINCHQEEVFSMGWSETKSIFKKYAPPQSQWGREDLEADFNRLAHFLDGYPLPIKLAASYMKENQCTLKMLCEDLDIEPLEVLESYSSEQRKEKSLRVTLEISFARLSVQAQDIFPLLAFFPSGLSRDLARAIWGRSGNQVLMELLKFSMAERSLTASDWRINLPEPARTYAKSKLQQGRGLDFYAPQVLQFYDDNFAQKVVNLFKDGNTTQGKDELLQENSNLILFLEWGYSQERSDNNICHSARITALLSPFWRWVEPNQDPLIWLNSALTAAQINMDTEAESLVNQAISNLTSQETFKDIPSLRQEGDNLQSFKFDVITVNNRGEEVNREQKQAEYYIEDLGNDVELDMISIPGGTFMMGSPEGEGFDHEKPQHQVTVTPFFMGKYPVTQAQWKAIASNTSLKVKLDLKPDPYHFKGDNRPVECVSWLDAVEFCLRLSKLTGKTYRLPTEAEWEYACRAGTTTPFYFGETITSELANYDGTYTYANEPKGEYRQGTTPVGQFPPNAFGLYDLHGNVWEWCLDPWHSNYKNAPSDGRVWDDELNEEICNNIANNLEILLNKNNARIIKGGSWYYVPRICRSACRGSFNPRYVSSYSGLRVVCAVSGL